MRPFAPAAAQCIFVFARDEAKDAKEYEVWSAKKPESINIPLDYQLLATVEFKFYVDHTPKQTDEWFIKFEGRTISTMGNFPKSSSIRDEWNISGLDSVSVLMVLFSPRIVLVSHRIVYISVRMKLSGVQTY